MTAPPAPDASGPGSAGAQGPVEPVPEAAAEVFGERLGLALRYAELLCGEGLVRGLIGPREPGRIWTRHVLNSAALASFVPAHASVVDLGSGAGLPGIPLVLARPDLRMTLLEPMARRVRFLELVRDSLDLPLTVDQSRAEAGPSGVDVVVARAVAPLGRLLSLAVPMLRPGGILLAQKGARARDEVSAAADVLERLAPAEVGVHPLPLGDGQTSVVRVVIGAGRRASNRVASGRSASRGGGVSDGRAEGGVQ